MLVAAGFELQTKPLGFYCARWRGKLGWKHACCACSIPGIPIKSECLRHGSVCLYFQCWDGDKDGKLFRTHCPLTSEHPTHVFCRKILSAFELLILNLANGEHPLFMLHILCSAVYNHPQAHLLTLSSSPHYHCQHWSDF